MTRRPRVARQELLQAVFALAEPPFALHLQARCVLPNRLNTPSCLTGTQACKKLDILHPRLRQQRPLRSTPKLLLRPNLKPPKLRQLWRQVKCTFVETPPWKKQFMQGSILKPQFPFLMPPKMRKPRPFLLRLEQEIAFFVTYAFPGTKMALRILWLT